jgi:nucleoside-triphosphatase THEP1
MPELFIVRGLPGCGKSTFANKIADKVFEADMYFYVNGIYKFDYTRIRDAHQWCQQQVRFAMLNGVEKIAVANTFVRRWEMDEYYVMALKSDYKVTEITLSGLLHPNVHGVPNEKIEQMRAGWEK